MSGISGSGAGGMQLTHGSRVDALSLLNCIGNSDFVAAKPCGNAFLPLSLVLGVCPELDGLGGGDGGGSDEHDLLQHGDVSFCL